MKWNRWCSFHRQAHCYVKNTNVQIQKTKKRERTKLHTLTVSSSVSFSLMTESKSKLSRPETLWFLNHRVIRQYTNLMLVHSCGPAKTTCPGTSSWAQNSPSWVKWSYEDISSIFFEEAQHLKGVKKSMMMAILPGIKWTWNLQTA